MTIDRKLCFVYGSLLSGGEGKKEEALGNHRIIADAKFLGEHVTKPVFTLISLGAFPGVVENGYGRKQIATAYGKAWIYLLPKSYLSYSKVFSGNWRTK